IGKCLSINKIFRIEVYAPFNIIVCSFLHLPLKVSGSSILTSIEIACNINYFIGTSSLGHNHLQQDSIATKFKLRQLMVKHNFLLVTTTDESYKKQQKP